jgi:hypothetical protein
MGMAVGRESLHETHIMSPVTVADELRKHRFAQR